MKKIRKVFIDGSAIAIKGGTSKYLINILKYLPQQHIALFIPQNYSLPFNFEGEIIRFKPNRFLIEPIISLYANKYALFFGPKSKLPINIKTKSLVLIHDTIPVKYPQTERFPANFYWKYHLKHASLKSDKIITISNTSKRDICNTYKINPDKIEVIYHFVEQHNISKEIEYKTLKKYALQTNNYILFVGTLQPRKGINILIKAFNILKKEGFQGKLCITGRYGWKMSIEHSKNNIIYTGYVDEKELTALYKNATVLASLSIDEGFGFPPIEAGIYGIPLVLSDIPIFRELHKKYGFFTNREPSSIAKTLANAIKRGYNKNQALYYRETFNREKSVNKTWAIMEKMLYEK